MKAICAWCSKTLGHRPPLSDYGTTHGICRGCRHRFFGEYLLAKGHVRAGSLLTSERRQQLADVRWQRRRARRLGQLSFSAEELYWLAGRARSGRRMEFAEALEREARNKALDGAWR